MKLLSIQKSTDIIPLALFWCKDYRIEDDNLIIIQDTGSEIVITDWDFFSVRTGTEEELVELVKKCFNLLSFE